MKKIISTIFILSLFHTVYAEKGGKLFPAQLLPETDTIPYVIDEDELSDYADSLLLFPAHDLYADWDTLNTHSAKFDVTTLKGKTKEIVLYDESSCGYAHPFAGQVTSAFGPRNKRFHYGADIDLETGDNVGAAFDGKVRIAKASKSYGNVVVIRHNNGLETYYAHLSKINVEVGDEVYAGQTIGLGGNTGRSRGSHLHFEVRYLGQPINPAEIISFTDNKLITDTLCLSSSTFKYIEDAKKIAAKSAKSKTYVIKKGDTLSSIARKYHTTPKAICKKNGIKITSTLHPGKRLKI